ncbi:MAG: hypothetical protein KDA44_05210 [Planctomycetales bacterium]|nr:hypothetical protein [Planctomycetales bacterium]
MGGLAELHAADLTLGPFELPDVLTSGDDAGSPETLRWLHAATLPVEAWSAGTALRRDERTLSAACQNGGMRQRLSAKQQDLRRLGLLTCCLAGGRQAVADADAKGRIKAIGGRRLRWFVRDLLQNEDGESHGSWLSQAGGFVTGLITPRGATSHVDAIGALQDWRKASTSQKPWWTAAFVALILLAALAVWGRRGSRTSNGLQRQLTTTMQQRDDAEAKLGQRTLELEECTRNLVECTRGSERESLADDGVDEERVTHFAASLLRNLLEDESLDREGLLIKAESSLADRETQSEQLQKIREWVGAFEGTTAYHIDVSSLQGKYVDYLLSIRIGDEWQVWENELKANDNYETPPSFEVSWQAGQSIAVLLEENGYTYNENLIEKTFAGPLALWLFHKSLQQLEGSDGKTVLTGEVVDCPGPPREWFKPILSK